jgi:uncharacterized cupin superfamily protein
MKRACCCSLVAVLSLANLWAQEAPKIVKFQPNGPSGKGLTEPYGTGAGKGLIYQYYASKANKGVAAGIFESADYIDPMHKSTNSEFIALIKGSFTLQDKSGREETFKAGDTLLIPRGTEFAWKHSENVKEYWVVFDFNPPSGVPTAQTASKAAPTFIRFEADGPAGKGLGPIPNAREYKYYSGPNGSSAGVWETDQLKSPNFHKAQLSELMVILKGSVTLSAPDGYSEIFNGGDVVLVPRGVDYKWNSGKVRKFWLDFDGDSVSEVQAKK